MTGGSLSAQNGGMFYTTNTESTFYLSDVDITSADDSEFFLLGNLEVSGDMQRRFIEGTGVAGPYGHIVNLKPEKTNAPKKIVKP